MQPSSASNRSLPRSTLATSVAFGARGAGIDDTNAASALVSAAPSPPPPSRRIVDARLVVRALSPPSHLYGCVPTTLPRRSGVWSSFFSIRHDRPSVRPSGWQLAHASAPRELSRPSLALRNSSSPRCSSALSWVLVSGSLPSCANVAVLSLRVIFSTVRDSPHQTLTVPSSATASPCGPHGFFAPTGN